MSYVFFCRFCPLRAGAESRPSFDRADTLSRHKRECKTCTASPVFDNTAYNLIISKGGAHALEDGRKKNKKEEEKKEEDTAQAAPSDSVVVT